MEKSQMVVATKYRLLVPISIKEGTFDPNGQKQQLGKPKLLSRDFVEQRNAHNNNELYIIDEEKTVELMQQREENIRIKNEADKLNNISPQDVVNALVNAAKGTAETPKKAAPKKVEKVEEPKAERVVLPEGEPNEDWDKSQLQQYCDERGLEYHHKAGKEKLLETIKASRNED